MYDEEDHSHSERERERESDQVHCSLVDYKGSPCVI